MRARMKLIAWTLREHARAGDEEARCASGRTALMLWPRFSVDMRDDFGHHPRGRDDARRSTRAHRVSLGVSSRVGIDAHAVQNARFTRSSRSRRQGRRPRVGDLSPPLAILPENITSGPIRSLETTSSTEDANPPKMEDANPPKTSPPPSLSPSAVRRVIRRRRLRPTTEDVRRLLSSHHRSKALFAVSRENLLFCGVSETRLARTGSAPASRVFGSAGSNARVSASLLPTIPSGVMTNENEMRRLLGLGLERAHARRGRGTRWLRIHDFANVLADDVKAPSRGEGEADGEAGHAW